MTLTAFRGAGTVLKILVVAALVCVSAKSLPRIGNYDAVSLSPSMGDVQALESKVLPTAGFPLVPVTLSVPSAPLWLSSRKADASALTEGCSGLRMILRC
jgi:hypothetical protein